jgi:hypothetical protein
MSTTEQMAKTILYEWWYAISEVVFERVCEITELDEEQREALRSIALRPNDFHVVIEGEEEEEEEEQKES